MSVVSIDELQSRLKSNGYIAGKGLSTSIFLALKLSRPLFLEGESGVGKTEVAKVLAELFNAELIRLQCYEGLDINQAVYEWNYTRQMMHIRLSESRGEKIDKKELFGADFLLRRPLLRAIDNTLDKPPILLIDEIDRSDEEFEAFLLELLSDFQISIPEIGTFTAERRPIVVLTSNRTREVHDALKRRCLYCWINYPTFEKELSIIRAHLPGVSDQLSRQVTMFVQRLRKVELYKVPGVAETLDWINALVVLNEEALDEKIIKNTLGALLKYRDDIDKVSGSKVREILDQAQILE